MMLASWRATSVLPTPVGPLNRNEPIGLSGSRRPARDSFIAVDSRVIASSCPNTTCFRSRSRFSSAFLSSFDTDLGGMRAIVAITISISRAVMVFLAAARRNQHLHRADFVDHVDRLVGQLAIIDVARRTIPPRS